MATFVEVDEELAGQRIDNFLLARLKGVPKSKIYSIIRKGEVRVNKGRVKPTHRICAGDIVRVPPVSLPEKRDISVSQGLERLLLASILYEDDDWLVVNKPGGLAVHGGSGISAGLVESMRLIRTDCRSLELCHRIDRDTSGCVVLAKKRSSLKRFHTALRARAITKRYRVLVGGRWPTAVDAVNRPLEKNVLASGERMVRVSQDGKPSLTKFKILDKFERHTLLEASPVTGRTHQIRVHCQAVGHAIVGDPKYGQRDVNRRAAEFGYKQLFLHAFSIGLPQYDGPEPKTSSDFYEVSAPYPQAWLDFMSGLGE